MIPSVNNILSADIEIETQPSLNYQMLFDSKSVISTVDETEAMKQVIFKILNTERYDYVIYSQNYGIELKDLYGEPLSYVCCELIDRITDALIQDDRIESVSDFDFTTFKKGEVLATFVVHTIFGDVKAERTVDF